MKTQIFSIIFIPLLLSSNRGLSQPDSTFTTQDTTLANKYFTRAEGFYEKAKYDSSIYYFEKARLIYEEVATQSNLANAWEKYIKCINGIGANLQGLGKYEKAMEYLDKALEIGLKKLGENHTEIANIYDNMGRNYNRKGNYEIALEYLNKALATRIQILGEHHVDVARAYHSLGGIYSQTGDYNRAEEYYRKTLSILKLSGEKHPGVAACYNNIANINFEKGYYEKAFEYFEKSLTINLELFGEKHPNISANFHNMGKCYFENGDFDKALEYLKRALAINTEVLGENHPALSYNYDLIGMIYNKTGDFEQVIDSYNRALNIRLQSLGEGHAAVAFSYNNLGHYYYERKIFDEAFKYFEKSLAIRVKLKGENHPDVAIIYNNIAEVFRQKKDDDKALEFFNKSIAINQKLFGINSPRLADTYLNIGQLYDDEKNYDQALYFAQKAMVSLAPDFVDSNIYANPSLKNISYGSDLLRILKFKADVFGKYYSLRSNDIKDMEMSFATFQLASELIDKMRGSYQAEGSKLFLGEQASEVFDQAIGTALRLYELRRDETYKENAFSFSEKAKSGVLLASLQDSRARQFTDIPDTLHEQEKQLRLDLAFYDTQIQKELEKKEKRDNLRLKLFEAQHFALNTQYQKLIKEIETEYPKYYDMKYQTHTATISELQRFLDEKSALLNYFISDSLIHVFVVSRDRFNVTSLEIDTLFDDTIESLNKSIKKLDASGFAETSFQAYNRLVKPIEQFISDKEKLVIIPHSILYKIPFEALLSQKPGNEAQTDFTKLDYLINRFDISYHYSATLYLNSVGTAEKPLAESWQKDNLFIGFAPVFSDEEKNGYILASNLPTFDLAYAESDVRSISLDGKRFNELQYSEKEVENIIKMYEKKRSEAIGFFHTDATEENFKSNVGNYRYVHIATHGIINEEKPQLSGIIFSQPTDSVYKEDGILYSNETYNLDLKADLVVLSSCESGIGKLVRGEGLMALTRGFLYSGASNIVVSLWKVSDKHTSQLMVEFYKNILAEKTYARSLREAKLRMIANATTAFPRSWSSFVLLGE